MFLGMYFMYTKGVMEIVVNHMIYKLLCFRHIGKCLGSSTLSLVFVFVYFKFTNFYQKRVTRYLLVNKDVIRASIFVMLKACTDLPD